MSALNIIARTIDRLGVPAGRLGNVVVVPGILGSDLADGDGRHLWLIPPRVEQLRLAPDGLGEAVVGGPRLWQGARGLNASQRTRITVVFAGLSGRTANVDARALESSMPARSEWCSPRCLSQQPAFVDGA